MINDERGKMVFKIMQNAYKQSLKHLENNIEITCNKFAGLNELEVILKSKNVEDLKEKMQEDTFKFIYYSELTDDEIKKLVEDMDAPLSIKMRKVKEDLSAYTDKVQLRIAREIGSYLEENTVEKLTTASYSTIKAICEELCPGKKVNEGIINRIFAKVVSGTEILKDDKQQAEMILERIKKTVENTGK